MPLLPVNLHETSTLITDVKGEHIPSVQYSFILQYYSNYSNQHQANFKTDQLLQGVRPLEGQLLDHKGEHPTQDVHECLVSGERHVRSGAEGERAKNVRHAQTTMRLEWENVH